MSPARRRRAQHPSVALLVLAALVTITCAAMHAAGWREGTATFSVVIVADTVAYDRALAQGALYASAYISMVLGAPVLVLAAALFAAGERLWRKSDDGISSDSCR